MSNPDIAVALTAEGEGQLAGLLQLVRAAPWSSDAIGPKCLLCKHADFSGTLIQLEALPADEAHTTMRLWIPHRFVAFAFDFVEGRPIGFHS